MKKLVLALSAFALAAPAVTFVFPISTAEAFRGCPSGYYVNSRGRCVRRPVRSSQQPAGATARCRDGTYSFSQSRRGTCSHHGGVAAWLD